LCGGYNANVLRAVDRMIKSKASDTSDTEFRVITSGKKAPPYLRYRGIHPEQSFTGMSDKPTFEDARRIAFAVKAPFVDEAVDQVLLVSTRFLSAGTQVVEARQILPIPVGSPISEDDADDEGSTHRTASPQTGPRGYTEFEPDGIDILDELVARYVEAAVFQAMLEAAASEHTARQRAMAAATENADELTKTLTRIMNRARQDAITTEIMEIVGGAEALRQGPEEE
jgi:F-type H+-transporting ATPase subunit gamma